MIPALVFVGFMCTVVTVTRMHGDGITLLGVVAWFAACLLALIRFAAQRRAPEGPTS